MGKSKKHERAELFNPSNPNGANMASGTYDEICSETKSKLGEILLTIADEENKIEKLRQNLATYKEFEPYSAFTRIDRESKGFIEGMDISRYLR